MKYILIICFLYSSSTHSHGGRTNSKGCHNNKKTGNYHCHNSKSKPVRQPTPNYFTNKNNKDSQFKCGNKTVCREMKSCSEAKFYLKKCGIYKLDGDHDGIPCESLCS